MSDFDTPQNDIERAIQATIAAGEDLDASARRAALVAIAGNNVTIILPPRLEDGSPPENAEPLFVSDGPDQTQAMLATFTNRERAQAFIDEFKADAPCEIHEIAGAQLVLGTPEEAGIMINPNQPLGFRIGRDLVVAMRGDVEASIEHLRGAPEPPPADGENLS